MRGWHLLPIALVVLVVIALPLAATTETDIERQARDALGLESDECAPMADPDSAWRAGPSLPYDLDEPRAITIDGKVYLAGGITDITESEDGRLLLDASDALLRFDPGSGKYERLAPMPKPLNHMGVAAYRGDLYVLGGYGETLHSDTSRAFYRYDVSENTWSKLPDLPQPRAAMAVGVIGNELIAAGGARDEAPVADSFAFDFETRRWRRLSPMGERREHTAAAALGGNLLVFGGRSPRTFASTAADAYDPGPAGQRWRKLPPMPVGAGGLAAVTVDGNAIVIGGGDDPAGTVTGAVQAWSPDKGRWEMRSGLHIPRHGHGAAVAGGRIWVFGGSPCAYFNATDSVEWLPARRR